MLAGIAAVAAGAMSMAVGEYVSVSTQGDLEEAELERGGIGHNLPQEAPREFAQAIIDVAKT